LGKCVVYAACNSAEIKETFQGINTYQSKLARARASQYPEINLLTYIAPTYEVSGDALTYEKDYDRWGPYCYSKLEVRQPLYTWGKIKSYKKAAKEGILVGKNEHRQKENEVIYEVKKYYYSLLLARKLKDVVEEIKKQLIDAIDKAEELYRKGTGEVKKCELEELKVYLAEAEKNLHEAVKSVRLARLALMQKMGMDEKTDFDISDKKLQHVDAKLKPVETYIDTAFKNRPEWNMVSAGLHAREALIKAEKSGYYPVFFAGGELKYNWSPVRDDQKNPWLNDEFNILDGGIAVGALFSLNPLNTRAKVRAQEAEYSKLKEKKKFAYSGIILQVKKAYYEIEEAGANIESAKKGRKAARKWVASAGLGYSFGTGEAEDALKGLAALAKAEKDYYQAIFDYNMAWAELSKAVGKELIDMNK